MKQIPEGSGWKKTQMTVTAFGQYLAAEVVRKCTQTHLGVTLKPASPRVGLLFCCYLGRLDHNGIESESAWLFQSEKKAQLYERGALLGRGIVASIMRLTLWKCLYSIQTGQYRGKAGV